MVRIGFDIGGTFTDLAIAIEGKPLVFHKVPSTSPDPAQGVLHGLDDLLARTSVNAEDIRSMLHATTVATNAILERKGAKTAHVASEGFRDIIIIGRQKRYDIFDLYLKKPKPLVERKDVFEVSERCDHHGEVLQPLDMNEVDHVISQIVEGGYESVSVTLMHAYVNASHERAIQARMHELAPHLSVTISSDVSPRYREYERSSTTVANAYVRPPVKGYLNRLETAIKERDIDSELSIMQSNGGLVSADLARDFPVRIVESGPAAGVLMCAELGRELGVDQILTFDMGGTTAKLGAIDGGRPAISSTFEVDMVGFLRGSGLPLNISSIELLEIGAGGGSIASVDMGLIKVGPQSAGAVPGPICYGKGGDKPTVTDANVVLGYIDPDNFNAGALKLDYDSTVKGVTEQIAQPLGISVGHAAWGIHAMVNSGMERALRIVSIERGRDPRAYCMVAFGGAGPLHAARLARQVGIKKVIIPNGAGVGSAVGLLQANPKVDVSITRIAPVEPGYQEEVAAVLAGMREQLQIDLQRLRAEGQEITWSIAAYMRYKGQGHEIRVELEDKEINDEYVAYMVEAFHQTYEKSYGYSEPGSPVEATEWYMAAEILTDNHVVGRGNFEFNDKERAHKTRKAYFPEFGEYRDIEIVDRTEIRKGEVISGPAVIEEREATTVILDGDRAYVSDGGHLVIDIDKES